MHKTKIMVKLENQSNNPVKQITCVGLDGF